MNKPEYFEGKCPECKEEAVGLQLENHQMYWCSNGHIIWVTPNETAARVVKLRPPQERPQ